MVWWEGYCDVDVSKRSGADMQVAHRGAALGQAGSEQVLVSITE